MAVTKIRSEKQLNGFLDNVQDRLVCIDFYADWCKPCRLYEPLLKRLSSEYNETAVFLKVDVDKLDDIATEFDIVKIPTIVIMYNDEELERLEGMLDEKALRRRLDHY